MKTPHLAALAAAQKEIDDCEAEIQAAVQPVPLHCEIEK